MPKIADKLSAVAFRLQTFREAIPLGTATGFVFRSTSSLFLITNYHVLSGYDPINGQPLHPQGALPDRIKFHVPTIHETEKGHGFYYREVSYELFDDAGKPLWHVHPRFGNAVDVAALSLGPEKAVRVWAMNDACTAEEFDDFPLKPGLDVFVIGFPLGLRVAGHLAIWKRGTIASEPMVDVDDKPLILIDSATRGGMSGSPVIAQIQGLWESQRDANKIKSLHERTYIGTGRKFVGVYSGRLGQDEFQAQLGLVWKREAIAEIVASAELQKVSDAAPGNT